MKQPGQPLRRSPSSISAALRLALPLALALTLADLPLPALAAGDEQPADTKAKREQELEQIKAEQKKAADAEAELAKQIATIAADRRRLHEDLINTASRIRAIEDRITASELRLASSSERQRQLQQSLQLRRGILAEVLAALQRLGRTPPRPILVGPEDALAALRTAMLLAGVLPDMQSTARGLAQELAELGRLRQATASEQQQLTHDLATLALDRQRLSLLIEERQKSLADTETALENQRQHTLALAHQADTLKDLMAKLEQTGAGQEARASAKELHANLATIGDPGRLSPAVAFAATKGALPLPVNGVRIRDFGSPDGLGGTEKGLRLLTRPAAQVTSPCDGWVVYAAPFRSYGQLLILNAGDGYHVLLAGMDRISVDLGQFVLTGEPVAVMGGGPQTAATVTIGSNQPILYVEFRKDGTPVDPSPWWATTESEKVRG